MRGMVGDNMPRISACVFMLCVCMCLWFFSPVCCRLFFYADLSRAAPCSRILSVLCLCSANMEIFTQKPIYEPCSPNCCELNTRSAIRELYTHAFILYYTHTALTHCNLIMFLIYSEIANPHTRTHTYTHSAHTHM